MRKGLKKVVAIVLTAAMAFSIGAPAFAESNYESAGKIMNTVVIDVEEKNEPTTVSPKAGDTEYKRELVETKNFNKKYIGVAGNQPSNGTVFSSPGGFYWSDGGNSVDVSFAMTAGVISLGISVGKTGSSGQFISAPVNTACKLHIYKDITVNKYAVYKKTVGSSTWVFDRYDYGTETTKVYLEVRAV